MMKLLNVLLLLLLMLAGSLTMAQNKQLISLKLEIDEQEVLQSPKVVFYQQKTTFETNVTNGEIMIVDSLDLKKNFDLRVIFDKYNLYFSDIDYSWFDSKWTVGVAHKPFHKSYMSNQNNKKIKSLYYIQFSPEKGLERRIVIPFKMRAKGNVSKSVVVK